MTALEKEKNDLVVFSIMLLISRLIPSSFTVEGDKEPTEGGKRSRQKWLEAQREAKHATTKIKFSEKAEFNERLNHLIAQIKKYTGNGTYFVRKIAA